VRQGSVTPLALINDNQRHQVNFVIDGALLSQHLTEASRPAVAAFVGKLEGLAWTRAEISAAIKAEVSAHGLKMPQLMMPLRVILTGQTQTPAVDAVVEMLGREEVLARLKSLI